MSKVFGIILILACVFVFAQENPVTLFTEMPNIIQQAREQKDVDTLAICATLLAYHQNMTGQRLGNMDHMEVLWSAVHIAKSKQDTTALENLAKICENKSFINDAKTAQEIRKMLKTKEPTVSPTVDSKWPSSKEILKAREYARVNAVENLVSEIYGVTILSLSQVENFQVVKDEVIAKIKANLLSFVNISEFKVTQHTYNSYEIECIASVQREQIMASVKAYMLQKKCPLSVSQENSLRASLKEVYSSQGIGIISR